MHFTAHSPPSRARIIETEQGGLDTRDLQQAHHSTNDPGTKRPCPVVRRDPPLGRSWVGVESVSGCSGPDLLRLRQGRDATIHCLLSR